MNIDQTKVETIKKRRSKLLKILIFLVVILIIGGIIFAIYFIKVLKEKEQAKQNPPKVEINVSSWKTYTNNTYGYSFKYPKDWNTLEKKELSKVIFSSQEISDELQKSDDIDEFNIGLEDHLAIIASKNEDNINSQQWIKENLKSSDYEEGDIKDTKVGLDTATSLVGYLDTRELIILPKENIYVFIFKYSDNQATEFKGIRNKILENFKVDLLLTKQEQAYTVQKGETLFKISLKFNIKLEILANYNDIPEPYNIKIGQVLKIPTEESFKAKMEQAGTQSFIVDMELAQEMQEEADASRNTWRQDALEVAKNFVPGHQGITEQDRFSLFMQDTNIGKAEVKVKSKNGVYKVELTQPIKKGNEGIWYVIKIEKQGG